jgi:hypothetical protein
LPLELVALSSATPAENTLAKVQTKHARLKTAMMLKIRGASHNHRHERKTEGCALRPRAEFASRMAKRLVGRSSGEP